ncbi:MAG TPA: acetyltransferase [Chryseosolibacter sp.]
MKNSLILIGGGGHCRSLIDVIEAHGNFNIVGIVDTRENVGREIEGYRIIGTDEDLPTLVAEHKNFVIAVGHVKSNAVRKKLFNTVKNLNGHFPTIVSPRAYVAKNAKLGEGVVVLHNAFINRNSLVEDNCIVNTGSIIEHDCKIGRHCHVAPHATVNGGCSIGSDVLIGTSAVIIQGVSIGQNSVVGAGAVVIRNVGDNSLVFGSPAKKIKDL